MELNETIKYLAENLTVELSSGRTGELNNQIICVQLKIGGVQISESYCEILISDKN